MKRQKHFSLILLWDPKKNRYSREITIKPSNIHYLISERKLFDAKRIEDLPSDIEIEAIVVPEAIEEKEKASVFVKTKIPVPSDWLLSEEVFTLNKGLMSPEIRDKFQEENMVQFTFFVEKTDFKEIKERFFIMLF